MHKLIKSLILLVSFFSIAFLGTSFAETTPSVAVKIATDKTFYALGEPVVMTITAVNSSDKDINLNFYSSKQTDYVIDEKFRWSKDKYFLTAFTRVTVPARGEYTWTMTHQNSDYTLAVGSHSIVGEVVGYGSASTQITVVCNAEYDCSRGKYRQQTQK